MPLAALVQGPLPRVPRVWWISIALLGSAATAGADFFSSSPGPLAQVHAHIDGSAHCGDCHVGSRDLAAEKCLACHKPIAERQRERLGTHASQKASGKPCELCHTDHKGLAKDILGFPAFGGRDHFDHTAFTRFPLEGKHQTTACAKCHTQRTASGTTTYLTAPIACIGCHASPHGDLLEPARRCERCHDAKSWRMVASPLFDHDRDTRYPLERKHEEVTCLACHATSPKGLPPRAKPSVPAAAPGAYQKLTFRWATWSGWAKDCMPCHDNVHGTSLFGQKSCKLCHSARVEFTKINFDHDRRTHFPLEGAHADEKRATCYSCHKKDEHTKPSVRCESCHSDVHRGRFSKVAPANDCAVCHTANNFPTDLQFDHNARTRFPLQAAHANADCRACHRGKKPTEWEHFEQLIKPNKQVACMGCHRHESVHQKQYTDDKCLGCHKSPGAIQTKPRAINEFHGPRSRFPLTEGHKNVECTKCHLNNVFTGAPLQCGPQCHADALHKGTLGNDCMKCHSGGRWEARRFDHDTKTSWPLVGNHREVRCDACHPRRDFAANRGLGAHCANCHLNDDPHRGSLGTVCEKCHSPTGKLLFEHNDPRVSDWPLEGAHAQVRCRECHASVRFKPTPRECVGCHPEPDVHKGQLGTLCSSCHENRDWKIIHTGHDAPSPRFGGAHDQVACVQCHPQGRQLAGTAQLCITCHRNDDVHHNALGPRCGECHTDRSWAGAHFEHTRVGCELVGVHRLVPCVDCHVGGNFVALSTECAACHRQDAIAGTAVSGIPTHGNFPTCSNCHNPNFFGPMSQGSHRESVCR